MGKISYSQFSMWDKCPYTWKANYVDKAETFKGNIYTLFGSAIHETIQAYLVCYYEKTIKEAEFGNYKFIIELTDFVESETFAKLNENTHGYPCVEAI